MRTAKRIEATATDRRDLQRIARSAAPESSMARRARIVLLAADGLDNLAIARIVGVGRQQVARWRERFASGGIDAILADRPRTGRPRRIDPQEILRMTTQPAPRAAGRWTTRSLAAAAGVSDTTVLTVWRARGIGSGRGRSVGLLDRVAAVYIDRSDQAIAVCCNGSEAEVALDRLASRIERANRSRRECGQGSDPCLALAEAMGRRAVRPDAARVKYHLGFLRRLDECIRCGGTVTVLATQAFASRHADVERWFAANRRFRLRAIALSLGIDLCSVFLSCAGYSEPSADSSLVAAQLLAAIASFVTTRVEAAQPFTWIASRKPCPIRAREPWISACG